MLYVNSNLIANAVGLALSGELACGLRVQPIAYYSFWSSVDLYSSYKYL